MATRANLLAPLYQSIYDFFGGNEMLISCVVSYVLMVVTFWAVGGFLLLVDLTGRPSWIAKFKVQPNQNVPVDREKLKKVLKTVAWNNLVLNGLSAYPIYLSQKRMGSPFSVQELPYWQTILQDFIISIVLQEIIFYYSHRLFHHPLIYKKVHSKHHQWTAPIGIVAIYTSSIEYLTGNGLSVFLGPSLCRSHIVTFWIWYTMATTVTVIHHSGYHLPFLPSPQFHDYHHLTFNWNYGTLGILDWLHGTDRQFRKTIQRRRHRTFFSTTPIHILLPDNKAKPEVEKPVSPAQERG